MRKINQSQINQQKRESLCHSTCVRRRVTFDGLKTSLSCVRLQHSLKLAVRGASCEEKLPSPSQHAYHSIRL